MQECRTDSRGESFSFNNATMHCACRWLSLVALASHFACGGGAPDTANRQQDGSAETTSNSSTSGTTSTLPTDSSTGTPATNTSSSGASSTTSTDTSTDVPSGVPSLFGAPLVFNPTANGFELQAVVLSGGDPASLSASVRSRGSGSYTPVSAPTHPAEDIAQWQLTGLSPGTHYEYRITGSAPDGSSTRILFEGQAVTQRQPGTDFSFVLITDTHVPQPHPAAQQRSTIEATYTAVMRDIADLERPDFIVNLGDMLDFHLYGFNAPPESPKGAREAYMNYRSLMGPLLGRTAHFPVIGNWEGENGCFGEDIIERSRSQRLLYMPAPEPTTYPEGGSPDEDYYAFEWGDALFVVLNVMTYTTTCHELSVAGGTPEDWTLGPEQLAWFEKTLAEATAKWRFVLIHHVVGGAAGNQANANYGRGGGQSAYIGEQALVHELMLQAGVQIFFYGHDHVFTDMVVDGIHYTMPGSAGAPWKFVTSETGYVNYWPDSGYGRVRVSPHQVQVDFVALGGRELYSYRIPDPEHVSLNPPPSRPSDLDGGIGSDSGVDASSFEPDASLLRDAAPHTDAEAR